MTQDATNNDSLIARALVEQGLVTRTELEDSQALLEQAKQDGSTRTLREIMIQNEIVTQHQWRRVARGTEEQTSAQQIPGYKILSRLGSGGMAVVFLAKQLSLDRMVAIKVLPQRMTNSVEFVERFYKEGKAAAKLNHPNIVSAVDVGEASGRHYFVMEYVEGGTVQDRLDKGGVYSEKESLVIVSQMASALDHAHHAGLVHRDVKPKNIMIAKDGSAKLADMGLAREQGDQQAAEQEAGKAFGTPYYISPEQIRGETEIDGRADIYGLGATFYHMVTGRVPFDGPSPTAVMHMHLKDELVPPDHLNPSLSAGVGEIIEMAMAKKKSNRYATALDMLVDLELVARGEPPKFARRSYDLNSLAELGKAATPQEDSVAVPAPGPGTPEVYSQQHTIDLAPPSLADRLRDPIVLVLAGVVVVELLIIIILLATR